MIFSQAINGGMLARWIVSRTVPVLWSLSFHRQVNWPVLASYVMQASRKPRAPDALTVSSQLSEISSATSAGSGWPLAVIRPTLMTAADPARTRDPAAGVMIRLILALGTVLVTLV